MLQSLVLMLLQKMVENLQNNHELEIFTITINTIEYCILFEKKKKTREHRLQNNS